MQSIEIKLGSQKYLLRGDESEEHLKEVGELVRRKIAAIQKSCPSLSFQKAAMLAVFDFASEAIKGKRRSQNYRSHIMAKAGKLLEHVQSELSSKSSLQ